MTKHEGKTYFCPVEATIDVIGGKWKPLICHFLRDGPLRYSELKRRIPNINERMLTMQLRELEADGIITRTIFNQIPPRVEYNISEYGETIRPFLTLMLNWGLKHINRNHLDFKPFEYDSL